MMKKNLLRVFCLVLVLTMVLGVIPAMAANDVTVYVSVSDQGEFALTKDGKPAAKLMVTVPAGSTVADAIAAAHAEYCPAGADGWKLTQSDWGAMMVGVWGIYDDNGPFGFYVNGVFPMETADVMTASEGDEIVVLYFRPDYSDTYAFFDQAIADVDAGQKLTLTLTANMLDENWNPVPSALAGAAVKTTDGAVLGTTDADGKVTVSFSAPGTYIVTAASETASLIPPSCIVAVKEASYKTYTVKAGDTLWSIAKATLGSGFRWGELYYLNADLLKSPRMIYVGQTLRIPA